MAAVGVPKEVTWNNIDKYKFFVTGAGMFSGVTCALYPLSVIKTRQMVDGSGR
jgi:solute carrier family 25 protein 44